MKQILGSKVKFTDKELSKSMVNPKYKDIGVIMKTMYNAFTRSFWFLVEFERDNIVRDIWLNQNSVEVLTDCKFDKVIKTKIR